ncbi:delta-aminolevulinic acid dehydratase [Planctomycetota bacterium]|nr:delta-aminolevulinic acid dehydratase [Planctomycetota bacterium]
MRHRPRRNRASPGIRALVRETSLAPSHLVLPLFIEDGHDLASPIPAMPGVFRWSVDRAVAAAREALELGVPAVALFPRIPDALKDATGSAAADLGGLTQRAVRALKDALPELVVITDVALDPYSSDGHDGVVERGKIANDATLPRLAAMAVAQATAGADVVAPSDMMDGRVAVIRDALDAAGFSDVLICSYCAKYASAFYGPFRSALDSAPKSGAGIPTDKATYQMDPANVREALREVALDEAEGADWLLIKPGLPYLDVIAAVRAATPLPVAAYQVSGEYAMLRAAAERGWVDYDRGLLESLTALRRAGADLIFTYGAVDAARRLNG